jgi:hypothetical protein
MQAWQMRTTARVVDQILSVFFTFRHLRDLALTGWLFFGDSSVVFYLEFSAFCNSTRIPSRRSFSLDLDFGRINKRRIRVIITALLSLCQGTIQDMLSIFSCSVFS